MKAVNPDREKSRACSKRSKSGFTAFRFLCFFLEKEYDVCRVLFTVFGDDFDLLWLKKKDRRQDGYFNVAIAGHLYVVGKHDCTVRPAGEGKKRPPEIFAQWVETLLKGHFAATEK